MPSPGRPKATNGKDIDGKKPVFGKKLSEKARSAEITDKLGEPTKCLKCGKTYPRQKSYFSPSYSEIYKSNNDFLPICKDCVDGLIRKYGEEYDDYSKAFYRICQMFDLYYSDEIYSSSKGGKGISFIMGSYASRMNGIQYQNKETKKPKTFDDTVREEKIRAEIADANRLEEERLKKEEAEIAEAERIKADEEEKEKNAPFFIDDVKDIEEVKEVRDIKVSPKAVKFWGYGYEPEEYKWMDDEYTSWVIRANNGETPSKSLENALKEMCKTYVDIKRARRNGAKANELSTLQTTYIKYMVKAGLSPDQEDSANIAEKNALGVLIDVWENTEPVPKYPEENKLKKYIRDWFKGHLAKCANLKNDTEEEYKAEIDKYKIKILEDEPVYELPPVTIEDGAENA